MTNSPLSSSLTTAAVKPAALPAGLATGVYSSGGEVGHHLEELRLSCAGVAHHAHVDVTPEAGAARSGLGHSAKQHQHDASLHLVIAVDGGEVLYLLDCPSLCVKDPEGFILGDCQQGGP